MVNEISKFKDLYVNMLNCAHESGWDDIWPFFIQSGKYFDKSKKRILFVGKSVNGWVTNSNNVDDLFNQESSKRIVNRSDQMEWVKNLEGPNDAYNTRKSAFWRVVKGVSIENENCEDWYNYISWSNLYKLSPEQGNPSTWMQELQRDYCSKIIDLEIETIKPKNVIFLTSFWEDFYMKHIGIDKSKDKVKKWDHYEIKYQCLNGIQFIRTFHPQGKDEKSHKKAINEIINSY